MSEPIIPDPPPQSSNRERILQFFTYEHLQRTDMKAVSKAFCDLANTMHDALARSPERTVMLRKLLEAKDAAVRALIYIP